MGLFNPNYMGIMVLLTPITTVAMVGTQLKEEENGQILNLGIIKGSWEACWLKGSDMYSSEMVHRWRTYMSKLGVVNIMDHEVVAC